jgi:hypothetical protein
MGLLLTILKIVADLITAGSAVWGLLTEFKDDKHNITRNGKWALRGIIAGLLVSISISVTEQTKSERDAAEAKAASAKAESNIEKAVQKARDEMKAKYESETVRLQRPLGHFHVAFSAGQTFTSVNYLKKLRNYLANQQGTSWFTTFKDLPTDILEDAQVQGMQGPLFEFAIYRAESGASCSKIEGVPDLFFDRPNFRSLKENPNVYLSYFPGKARRPNDDPEDYEPDDKLVVSEENDLQVLRSSQQLASTEDLFGAVMWIRQPTFLGKWDLENGTLTLAEGVKFSLSSAQRFPRGARYTSRGKAVPISHTDYCYVFPRKEEKASH